MEHRPQIWNSVPVPYGADAKELIRLAGGPAPDRWAAFVALAHSGEDSVLVFLRESAESSDPHVRRIAAEAIGVHQDGSNLAHAIMKLLYDSYPEVVRSACEAAGRLRLTEAHDTVARLLDSPDRATRRTAARVIRSLWVDTDFARLLQTFTSDPDTEVKKEAAWTLRATASTSTWRQLFEIWQADALPRHRGWAAELAGAYGDEEVLPPLRGVRNDVDGHVRRRAVQAIRNIEGRVN